MTKRKWKILRFRKNDPAHNLLAATQHWIRANKGTAAVIGGIGTMKLPGDPSYKYYVTIGVVGMRPEKSEKGIGLL